MTAREPFPVFIGYDPRDHQMFQVCAGSLLRHASIPVTVYALADWQLREAGLYWRRYRVEGRRGPPQYLDEKDGPFTTQFSYTRYLVPRLAERLAGRVLFCDPDMVWRADIRLLLEEVCAMEATDGPRPVWCVKHDQVVASDSKMGGLKQWPYQRKNWSSLMVLDPQVLTRALTPFVVNNWARTALHQMDWIPESQIGELMAYWNVLEGQTAADGIPERARAVVHFTRGTPDMVDCEAWASAVWQDERAEILGASFDYVGEALENTGRLLRSLAAARIEGAARDRDVPFREATL